MLGLKHVAFVGQYYELRHWMLGRLIKRARGLDPKDFWFLPADHINPTEVERLGIKVLIPLGERPLQDLIGESDIERWRGRVVPYPRVSGVWIVPTFAPSRLLPQRGETSVEIMRNPPRFHGVFMRDVLKALDVAQNGFIRKEGSYLLDPQP